MGLGTLRNALLQMSSGALAEKPLPEVPGELRWAKEGTATCSFWGPPSFATTAGAFVVSTGRQLGLTGEARPKGSYQSGCA